MQATKILFLLLLFCPSSFASDTDLYEATVRIRVQNNKNDENEYGGTGVIIDAKDGVAQVLSVAHLFDASPQEDMFCRVELFKYKKAPILDNTYAAKIVYVNPDSDVAFLSFKYTGRAPKFRKLAASFPRKTSEYMYKTVGCPELRFPHLHSAQIICVNDDDSLNKGAIDSYKLGYYPHLGRSGSGLFNKKEEVIGVLSYRYDDERTCVYVGGGTIKRDLSKLKNKEED